MCAMPRHTGRTEDTLSSHFILLIKYPSDRRLGQSPQPVWTLQLVELVVNSDRTSSILVDNVTGL